MAGEKVYLVDRVVTTPGRARAFVDAYLAEYAPGGRSRGMTLDQVVVSPPMWLDEESNTVTITWSLDDVAAVWAMIRAGRGDPGLAAWWSRMAPMIVERTRSMSAAAADIAGLGIVEAPVAGGMSRAAGTAPAEGATACVLTRVAHFAASASAADRAAVEDRVRRAAEHAGAARIVIGPTLPGVINGGDLLIHLQFPADGRDHEPAVDAALKSEAVERFHGVRYRPGSAAGRKPGAAGTVYRTLLLRVAPGAAPGMLERFESETLLMPRHIDSIRAWRLSRVDSAVGPTEWTHVWEQEFDALSALEGEYLRHPIHWGVVDRWFDPESPDVIIRDRVCHTFCAIDTPVIPPS